MANTYNIKMTQVISVAYYLPTILTNSLNFLLYQISNNDLGPGPVSEPRIFHSIILITLLNKRELYVGVLS